MERVFHFNIKTSFGPSTAKNALNEGDFCPFNIWQKEICD